MKKIKQWLTKLICPSGSTLAGYAADGIADAFNKSNADLREKVAKYSTYAKEVNRIADTLTGMLVDGNIDKIETEALKEMLTPLFNKALALV